MSDVPMETDPTSPGDDLHDERDAPDGAAGGDGAKAGDRSDGSDGAEAVDPDEIDPDEVDPDELEVDAAENEALDDLLGADDGDESGEAVDAAVDDDASVDDLPTDGSPEGAVVAIDAEELLEEQAEEEVEEEISPYDRPGRWYVVHTQSGYENKVKQNLEARTSSMNMEGRIHEVVIPTEDDVEFKGGRKVVVQRKVFPGYLLVRCELDDDAWFVIRQTPGVTGFVGAGNKPSPLPRRDVETFLQVKPKGEQPKRGKPKLEYEMGETVRVKEGPFADFSGQIVELNEDQLKVKVLVNIFGRETPVELEFGQIARL